MPEFVIHIGSPKTGTTSLQDFLSANKKSLFSGYGVLYPESGRNVVAHHPLAADLRRQFNGDKIPDHCYGTESRDDNWERLLKELEGVHGSLNKVIVSSEDFFVLYRTGNQAALERIKEILSGWSVKVVVYLRRQDYLVDSLYNQAVKATLQSEIEPGQFVSKHPVTRQDYYKILCAWGSVFGFDNVIVRPFDKKRFTNGSLEKDFFESIGVSLNDDVFHELQSRNDRLSPEEVILKRELNKEFEDNIKCIRFFDRLRDIYSPSHYVKDLCVTKADYNEIVSRSKPVNDKISEKFMQGEKLFEDFPDGSDIRFLDLSDLNLGEYLREFLAGVSASGLSKDEAKRLRAAIFRILDSYNIIDSSNLKFIRRFLEDGSNSGFFRRIKGVFLKYL